MLIRREQLGESSEGGSEVVSTVFIQALVMFLVLAMLQLGFALHTRNMAISAAGEGARRGGLLGGDESEAVARTSEILDSLVGASAQSEVKASRRMIEGAQVLQVEVTTSLPILVNIGPKWLTVHGTALIEDAHDE